MKTCTALALVALVASASAWEMKDKYSEVAGAEACGMATNCMDIPGASCDGTCNLGVCPTDGSTTYIVAAGTASNSNSVPCNGEKSCLISTTVTFTVEEDATVTFGAGACSVPLGPNVPVPEWTQPHLALTMDGNAGNAVCEPLAELDSETLCYDTGKVLQTFDLKAGKVVTAYLCGAQGVFTFSVRKSGDDVVPGGGEGDPHFTGFDGRPFDYAGVPGAIFNVVSTPTVNVNAALVPEEINGLTYMGAVGVTTASGRISVTANPETESLIIEANDKVVDSANLGSGVTVERVDAQTVNVETDALSLTVAMRHNQFVDITRAVLLMEPTADNVHGVLGQTAMPARDFAGFSGEEEEYFVSSLFGEDFAYNRFTGSSSRTMAVNSRASVLTATATNNDM